MSPEGVLLAARLLLAVVLYAFLGILLWFLARDLRQNMRAGDPLPTAHVLVANESEGPKGYRLSVTNLIGRAADNSICLDDSTISAYHARLSFQGGQWWLEDLGSRNGTGVNDLAIEEPLVVTYGDRIRVGRVEVKLVAGDPPGDAAGK
ncbi:MAG: FHA domain-containing protein [Anaerolineales bacterium]